eukprot:9043704-Pyramimonas_sp.AAC.1
MVTGAQSEAIADATWHPSAPQRARGHGGGLWGEGVCACRDVPCRSASLAPCRAVVLGVSSTAVVP